MTPGWEQMSAQLGGENAGLIFGAPGTRSDSE